MQIPLINYFRSLKFKVTDSPRLSVTFRADSQIVTSLMERLNVAFDYYAALFARFILDFIVSKSTH